MSSDHKCYVRQEKARDDKKQQVFGSWGEVEPRHKPTVTETFTLDINMQVSCPFCLYHDKLQRFLVSTAKGISQSKALCPECHNGMLMKSLTADWTPEQYADWVFRYAADGFWKKCPFVTWKKALKEMGWAGRFWDRYKALKGESYPEGTTEEQEEAWKQYESGANEQ